MIWRDIRLADVSEVGPRDPALSEDAPFVPMAVVEVGRRHPTSYERRGSRGGIRARGNDVLFARITPCLENGKLAQLPPDAEPTGGSTEFIVVRAGPELDPGYLYYWCASPAVRDRAESLMTGTTGRMRFAGTDLADFRMQLPPLEEQRRIVDLLEDHLSRLDAATAYLNSANQRLTAMERSALNSLFGGTDVSLAELIDDISAGKSFGGANAPAREHEWGIIKVSAMTWGQFNSLENKAVPVDRVDPRFEIREGDLLVSRANTEDYVGASVLVGEVRPKLLLSDKSLRVVPKAGVQPAWLWRALQAPSARRQITALATGTKESMRNISQESLKRVLLPRATESAQASALNSFAETEVAVSRMRAELDAAERRSAALRRSLLAAAFSGRLTGGSLGTSKGVSG